MKKLFLSIAAMAAICAAANAQEAFKHLSAGVGVGTAGINVELALPVVTNHLVLKAGYNFPATNAKYSTNLDLSSFSNNINKYVSDANAFLSQVPGETARMEALPSKSKLDAQGMVNFNAFKAMLEYYPSKNSGFHITAGVFFGGEKAINADATASELWNVYAADKAVAESMASKYPEYSYLVGKIPELAATVDGKTYKIVSPGNVNLGLTIAKVRPYLGIGFGKSVPDTRCGFQFDLGAVYLGKVNIVSANEVALDSNAPVINAGDDLAKVTEVLSKCSFYPYLDFKFIVRIF